MVSLHAFTQDPSEENCFPASNSAALPTPQVLGAQRGKRPDLGVLCVGRSYPLLYMTKCKQREPPFASIERDFGSIWQITSRLEVPNRLHALHYIVKELTSIPSPT